MNSQYIKHDSRTGKQKIVTENTVRKEIGQRLLEQLAQSGSLSSGSTLWEFRDNLHEKGYDEFGAL